MRLEQAEVEEGDPAVGQPDHVAGMRIAGEAAVAVHRAEVEAEDDLADPVALGVGLGAQRLEAVALDELGDDHPLAAERGDHPRDVDERVAVVEPGHRPLVGGLELVVELIDDALADLGRDAPWCRAPASACFISRSSTPRFFMSARTASSIPGYWTLTATWRPSAKVAR